MSSSLFGVRSLLLASNYAIQLDKIPTQNTNFTLISEMRKYKSCTGLLNTGCHQKQVQATRNYIRRLSMDRVTLNPRFENLQPWLNNSAKPSTLNPKPETLNLNLKHYNHHTTLNLERQSLETRKPVHPHQKSLPGFRIGIWV